MYNFILIQWQLGNFDVTKVNACATKGYITQVQADQILAMS